METKFKTGDWALIFSRRHRQLRECEIIGVTHLSTQCFLYIVEVDGETLSLFEDDLYSSPFEFIEKSTGYRIELKNV